MFLLTTEHILIYDYMVAEYIGKENCCCHVMGYSFQLSARYLLCLLFHRQESMYVPRPLLHQLWSTGWNEKNFNGSAMRG